MQSIKCCDFKNRGLYEMNIIVLDTETTGLKQEAGHKIIEIALLTYDLDSEKLIDTWVQRFDPQMPIDPGAQAVHGIAYSDLAGCPTWEDMAQEISDRMTKGNLLVAHNMSFDGPFIGCELQRVGVDVPDVHSFCTMENARWACPDGKMPKLLELAFALGVEYDKGKAHAAEYDVLVTAECFFRGLKRGFYELPKEARGAADFKNCYDDMKVAA
jgi:DNA polymerase-3 subunit epsilon